MKDTTKKEKIYNIAHYRSKEEQDAASDWADQIAQAMVDNLNKKVMEESRRSAKNEPL